MQIVGLADWFQGGKKRKVQFNITAIHTGYAMSRRSANQSAPSDPYQVPHELLESAALLYFDHRAYSAALHLAGAAEELLGKLLRERDGTSWLDSIQQICMDAWNTMTSERPVETVDGKPMSPKSIAAGLNSAKNHVKHSNVPGNYDARTEACWMMWRALSNHDALRQADPRVPADTDWMDRLHDECVEILLGESDEHL